MSDSIVTIKGVKDGLLITLNAEEELSAVTAELAARIDEKGDFFQGALVTLDVGTRPLRRDELGTVKALLERRGMALQALTSDSNTALDSALALDLRVNGPAAPAAASDDLDTLPFRSEEDGTEGVMIRRTLRSGRTITSAGHVVVVGAVTPGAEIVAAGDVVIWGRLRGRVHAGVDGDENAVICALDMQPTQLRIAGYIVTSPKEKRRKPKPEFAAVREGQIVVDGWDA